MGFLGGNAITVVDFWAKLQSQPDLAKSRVLRLTHVKNLDSSIAHEYLQFILLTKEGRERVIVERTDPDQLVFNGKWTKPDGLLGTGIKLPDPFNLAKSDLPLPLYSLAWDEQKAPTLHQFTQICKSVHNQAPDYSLPKAKHFYWYFSCVYQSTKLAYGGNEKKWLSGALRGSPTFLLAQVDSNMLKTTAASSQKDRAENTNLQVRSGPNVAKNTLETVESITPAVGNEEFQKEYLQEMQAPEESVHSSIIDCLDIPTTPRKEPSANVEEICDTLSFQREYEVLKETMEKDPTADENVTIFRNARNARANEGRDPSEPMMMEVDTDEFEYFKVVEDSLGMNWAMDAFIGKTLKDIGVTPKVQA